MKTENALPKPDKDEDDIWKQLKRLLIPIFSGGKHFPLQGLKSFIAMTKLQNQLNINYFMLKLIPFICQWPLSRPTENI